MDKPASVADLTTLGRVRLSDHFFMRDMLYSEVANFHGLSNIPDDPDLAVATGEKLCQLVLEPLHRAFGGIAVRSAFRSAYVNDYCHQRSRPGQGDYFCSDNVYGAARHIWDLRDAEGYSGATASVVVPWYLDHFERTNDHRPLGWWIRDHIADYAEVQFYPWLCAFNIRWYEGPSEQVILRGSPAQDDEGVMTRRGMDNFGGDHAEHYPDFPQET